MNIEEARKVLWLKSNPRPLGELLDEGFLTRDRLEWAAKWAYNSKLQQAAKVILASLHQADVPRAEASVSSIQSRESNSAIDAGISLEKAKTVSWPFGQLKGQPMGSLVDSRQLQLKDLAYAIENAWDVKVRKAAIALTLARLDQVVKEPTPSAGFIHVVSGGRSFAERRESRLTLLQGMVLGWTIILFLGLLWFSVAWMFKPHSGGKSLEEFIDSPLQLIIVIVVFSVFIAVGLFLASIPERISKQLDKRIEESRLGQEGEDSVVQLILQALDGNWHLFRNIVIPGRNKADLDLVLVGPPGVWALEVKNFNGIYRNRGEAWEYKTKKSWKTMSRSPSRQAYNSSLRLANFLKADHVNVFVNPAVVWANATSPLDIENPSVAVWEYLRLADELGNIWQGEKLSETERAKIVEKLTKQCDWQKDQQEKK